MINAHNKMTLHPQKIIRLAYKYSFISTIVLFTLYSAMTIYRSSFVVHGVRYFTLSDDEMIGMRYAYNLAHGYGLVWNAGQHVEGITNPLWVIYMSIIHFFPVPLSKTSLFIQISALAFTIISLYFVKKIAELLSNKSYFVVFFSVLFSAFYYPLINWDIVLGTEVSGLLLLLMWSTYLALRSVKTKKFSLLIFILLGLGILIRMDFIVSALIISIFLIIFNPPNRKRYLSIGIPLLLAFPIVLTLFRVWYYHDPLPNTYYDKLTGYPLIRRITRGVFYSIKAFLPTFLSTNLLLVLAPFLYAFFSKNKYILLLVSLLAAQLLYNSYVGADVWEENYGGANRFVAFTMPLFFVALLMGIYSFRKLVITRITHLKEYLILEIACTILIFLVLNRINAHILPRLILKEDPTTVFENRPRVAISYCIKDATKPSSKIGVTAAGIVPYFLYDRYFIDTLGKTEPVIAHEPAHDERDFGSTRNPYTSFSPGHNKWDYNYVIRKYRPDLFIDIYASQWNLKYLSSKYELTTIGNTYEGIVIEGLYSQCKLYVRKGQQT